MSVEAFKELDDFFRSMRQAFNSRDIKTFRTHFWTDKRFLNIDSSGRVDLGWGAYEEVLDQEFRYLESIRLELKDPQIQVFDDQFGFVYAIWKIAQVDPEGREVTQAGRATFTVARVGDAWKIVAQHFSSDEAAAAG
jgi:ketosteroid isomerase-like protein